MEEMMLEIIDLLRGSDSIDERTFTLLVNKHNARLKRGEPHHSKRRLLQYFLAVRESEPERLAAWGLSADPALEQRLARTLQLKPRRSASGVATITLITRPQPCGGDCIYCPNDLRMPKSYLHREPACLRAEACCFDPYLQTATRLRTLRQMGHATDKIEVIILGGSWSDYPLEYRLWFMTQVFRALNDPDDAGDKRCDELLDHYSQLGLLRDDAALDEWVAPLQQRVDAGELGYNQAFRELYGASAAWRTAASEQTATWQELEAEQRTNETAAHRVVGLVIETRPNTITPQALLQLRRMGCTKIQVGIQTLDPAINAANDRPLTPQQAQRCFELLRLFGFKIHSHFMLNLLGATPESDLADYRAFMTLPAFQPDEVKLYPCALIGGTRLERVYEAGEWRPYSEQELVDTIAADVRATPPWCRLSRIIRDFSACDIVAGSKQGNLRQEVERRLREEAAPVQEIRFREISMEQVDPAQLELQVIPYETTATSEYFLQWVTPENRIVGFLRLSIPHADAPGALLRELEAPALPLSPDSAMIREVHVYGRATALGDSQEGGAQHQGLGRRLIAAACDIAREQGATHINVISSVGTREYYRALGFRDAGLYQTLTL